MRRVKEDLVGCRWMDGSGCVEDVQDGGWSMSGS